MKDFNFMNMLKNCQDSVIELLIKFILFKDLLIIEMDSHLKMTMMHFTLFEKRPGESSQRHFALGKC